MRNALAVSGLILVVWGTAQLSPAQAPTTIPPRLLVVISVDQMRPDYLGRFGPLFTGGLKTLLERGAAFSSARFRHANCETGPGHSVLLSGRNALHSGIVANEWYDETLGRVVNVVDDPTVLPVGGAGRGASPAHFIGFTLGGLLKKAQPDAKVVGVSLKDRSAILMAGPRADAAYWYESGTGRFITSTYYMKTAPTWLNALNDRKVPDSFASKSWTRMLSDDSLYLKYAGGDDVATEADLHDTTFPHRLPAASQTTPTLYDRFRRTPFADELTLDVALAAMDAHGLGNDEITDILAVGFSATDFIGHAFGPDSHETMDQILRLDRTIGRLIDAVQAKVGKDGATFVLSADHGVMPLVESLQARGAAAKRVRPADLEAAGMAALQKRFPGARDLVAMNRGQHFYLNLSSIALQGLRRQDVEKTLGDALLATGVVAKVYTAATFAGDPPAPSDDAYFDAVRRSYFPSRSPHVTARLKEHMYLTRAPGGTGHGTPYEYDRHVPLVFMGPAVKAGVYDGVAAPEDIAPTLGVLLGIEYPLQDANRALTEMMRRQVP